MRARLCIDRGAGAGVLQTDRHVRVGGPVGLCVRVYTCVGCVWGLLSAQHARTPLADTHPSTHLSRGGHCDYCI